MVLTSDLIVVRSDYPIIEMYARVVAAIVSAIASHA